MTSPGPPPDRAARTPLATHRLLACADIANRLRERDERNNCRAWSGRVRIEG